VACRHMMQVYKKVPQATFNLGLVHSNLFKEEQAASAKYPSVASPSCRGTARGPPVLITVTRAQPEPYTGPQMDAGAPQQPEALHSRRQANIYAMSRQIATGESINPGETLAGCALTH
jgi:hypothetical protein